MVPIHLGRAVLHLPATSFKTARASSQASVWQIWAILNYVPSLFKTVELARLKVAGGVIQASSGCFTITPAAYLRRASPGCFGSFYVVGFKSCYIGKKEPPGQFKTGQPRPVVLDHCVCSGVWNMRQWQKRATKSMQDGPALVVLDRCVCVRYFTPWGNGSRVNLRRTRSI